MESDPRYQWLEQRITLSLNPKREALLSLSENEDNKYVYETTTNNLIYYDILLFDNLY